MRRLLRALVSAAVGLLVATAGYAYASLPVTTSCGGGGFDFSNAFYDNNSSLPPQYGWLIGQNWTAGSTIAFTWTSTGNGSATLTVLDPDGQPIYAQTGILGQGSFTANAGTYNFALPVPPPVEGVSVSYQCSTTS